MRIAVYGTLVAVALTALSGCELAKGGSGGNYEVAGVEANDMLKMRAGPGIGYRVIVGLPNGTALRISSCQQTGGTRWCKASLSTSPGLEGYVSWAYLKEI